MTNRVVKAAVIVATALAGVSPVGAAPLPPAKAERAILCSRAALAYASATDAESPERDRRGKLFRAMVDASHFFDVTGLDEAKGNALLQDISTTVQDGDWLATVNECKEAYALGAAEPLPALPVDLRQRSAICAAIPVARILGSSGPDLSTDAILGRLLGDPTSAYYFLSLMSVSGGLTEAQDASTDEMEWIIESGATGHLERECAQAFPGALEVRSVSLPADLQGAAFACLFNSGFLEGLAIDEGERARAMGIKIRRINLSPDAAHIPNAQQLIEQSLSLGPPFDILSACEARFN
jgi:hypothetical protein